MKELCLEFEQYDYIERMIALRQSDPVTYGTLPEAVKLVVEEYERKKEAEQTKGRRFA